MNRTSCFLFAALTTGAIACASSEDPGDDGNGSGASSSSASSGSPSSSSSTSGSPSSSSSSGSGGSEQGGAGGMGGMSATGGATSSSAGGTGGVGGGGSGGGGSGGAPVCPGLCVDDPDPATRCSGDVVVTPLVAPAGAQWATSVVAFSSEYSNPSWSAMQATGAPNTYPVHDDETTAWAPLTSDGAGESITLGFSPAATGTAIWIYETYNPDAVKTVTVTTQAGDTVVYQAAGNASVGGCAYVVGVPTNTTDPITQVKIDLASELVSGWNEIDAVGIMP